MSRPHGVALAVVSISVALARCSCPAAAGTSCGSSADCLEAEVCVESLCRTACNADSDCELSQRCVDGACMPILRDAGGTVDAAPGDSASADSAAVDRSVPDGARPDTLPTDTLIPDSGAVDQGADDDAGSMDAGTLDAATADSVLEDATASDLSAPEAAYSDAPLEDAAIEDAFEDVPAIDAGWPLDAGATDVALPGCSELYGAARDFRLCQQQEQLCRFNARTNGSCDNLCSDLGGICVDAYNDRYTGTCQTSSHEGCWSNLTSQICVCTRFAPVIDAGAPVDAAGTDATLAACDETFGGVQGFTLCAESAGSCEFYADEIDSNCAQLCAAAGRSCVIAYNDDNGHCERDSEHSCSYDFDQSDGICMCTR